MPIPATQFIWFNGKLVPWEKDTVHVLARQRGVMASYSLNQHQAPNEVTAPPPMWYIGIALM